jgi:hypothetical protein
MKRLAYAQSAIGDKDAADVSAPYSSHVCKHFLCVAAAVKSCARLTTGGRAARRAHAGAVIATLEMGL